MTSGLQVSVVLVTGSVALLADTIHNFADALTAVPLWIAFVLGRRVANKRYTYGYGRSEDLAGLFVLVMIAFSSALAAWQSIDRLLHPSPCPTSGSSPWRVSSALPGNELVALYRIRVGKDIGSAALVADGYHARTDGLTSLAVVIGALGIFLGFPQADPIIGLLITVAILWVLKGAAVQVFGRLMDAVDPALTEAVERAAAQPGVVEVTSARLRWIGHRIEAEAHVTVDRDLTTLQSHAIAEIGPARDLPRRPEDLRRHRPRRSLRPRRARSAPDDHRAPAEHPTPTPKRVSRRRCPQSLTLVMATALRSARVPGLSPSWTTYQSNAFETRQ
ncbi:MAG: cation diffusion facilitator family transporter [Candidatus Limnocylindrales bacterium]